MTDNVLWFEEIGMNDVAVVGGKNASLGEMINHLTQSQVKVPRGFATTAKAYRDFLAQNNLDQKIYTALAELNINDVQLLAKTGSLIREWIMHTPLLPEFESDVRKYYQELISQLGSNITFAVRSSATAEDLPDASFAGQQETYLNVSGIDEVLIAIKKVFASLYNDRAIAYRVHYNFEHQLVALSAGIQQMVRSDLATSGVMFSIDTESGFDKVIFINASYGLGEPIVQGQVNPDEFYVYKPNLTLQKPAILRRNAGSKLIKMIFANTKQDGLAVAKVDVEPEQRGLLCLNDAEVEKLAKDALAIEQHYGRAMDIEWAKDGVSNQLYIVQARPETVKSRHTKQVVERYQLQKRGEVIVEGRSVGQKIGAGLAKIVLDLKNMDILAKGDILVTDMTDPDWEPVMKRAAAIVTNRGGRTCHAAIVARELGIPAVVGTGDATKLIQNESEVTVSCAEGDTGFVYKNILPFTIATTSLEQMPKIPVKIMMNLANPDSAFDLQFLPNYGVGLARLEFIINQMIGIHPKALLNFAKLPQDLQQTIREKTKAYKDPVEFYIERLKEGIATIAAAFFPKMIIVRFSDFKSNEYANLIGGKLYEPSEENPMIGFRGASRYVDPLFSDCFKLECQAIKRVRDEMGLTNVAAMVPFCRTVAEAKAVIEVLAQHGLKRGENDLKVIMMCEIPSNALLANEFLDHFDGFSIGSNDLTQLTLGLDRDSGIVAKLFEERDEAVKALIHMAISVCKARGKYIGICGQGPSDHPDFAKWLIDEGIESISLNPDTVVDTWLYLAGQKT
ncbi:MAG: phosphoenolpyruvate synthase [Gammaproteobacteria bacterium]|nr:phosphoenolpyruvate synthase [Gammaproteobacteria bacterium]